MSDATRLEHEGKEEFTDLLRKFNLEKDFEDLPESLKSKVKSGIEILGEVNKLGASVENEDRRVLIGDVDVSTLDETSFQAKVAEELRQIGRVYHEAEGGQYDWFRETSRDLLSLAKHTNYETRSGARNQVFANIDAYRQRLVAAGNDYQLHLENSPKVENEADIRGYITGERDTQVQMMSKWEDIQLSPIISTLRPED
ncbi:MAG: hypothetical protein ACHQUA_00075 [Microgenomates group bacterium]